jgi:hypothetical protein
MQKRRCEAVSGEKMTTTKEWREQRRNRQQSPNSADAAIALCARHVKSGALADASRAALLAQRLIQLETAHAERRRRQEIKAAHERRRAEAALAQARKAVASLAPPPPAPAPKYNINCADKDWPETLKRMIADANAQRSGAIAEIGSGPEQKPPPDSC